MKRLLSLIAAVAMLFSLCVTAHAEDLDINRKGSITIHMSYGDTPVPGGTIKIYRVAGVKVTNGNPEFVPLDYVKPCVDNFNSSNIHSATTAYTLSVYVANDHRYIPTQIQEVDAQGNATFEDLELGIYLVYQSVSATGYFPISPFLVTVPSSDFGYYLYDIEIDSKVPLNTRPTPPPGSVDPPPYDPDDPDNPYDPDDPDNPYDPDDPNYPPYDPDDPTVEPGESATDDEDNTVGAEDPDDTDDPDDIVEADPELPQTGQLNWPIPVLVIAGLLLFMLGWSMFFKTKRDTNES